MHNCTTLDGNRVATKEIMALMGFLIAMLGVTSITWISAHGQEYTALGLAGYSLTCGLYSYGILIASILGLLASGFALLSPSSFFRKMIGISGIIVIVGWVVAAYHLGTTTQLWITQFTFVNGSEVFGSIGFYLPLIGGILALGAAIFMEKPIPREEEAETFGIRTTG